MFDPKIIKQEFSNLVGFRQNNDPAYPAFAEELVYNGDNTLIEHPLINIENIASTAKNYAKVAYPVFSSATQYEKSVSVTYNNKTYQAITTPPVGTLPTDVNFWQQIDPINIYLKDIVQSCSEDVVTDMLNAKRDVHRTKTLIQSMRFYEGAGSLQDRIINNGKLVGVRIDLLHSTNLVAIVERIGLQLSSDSTITLYVFHSSQPEAITTIEFVHNVPGGFKWITPAKKIALHNLNNQYDAGGSFYIMYNQNELSAQAINKRMDFHAPPCSWCSTYNVTTFAKFSKYLSVRAVHIDQTDRVDLDGTPNIDGVGLFNTDKIKFDLSTNWGLNFDFTIRCDITDFIVRQKDIFADALKAGVIVRLLSGMVNSTRQNGIETIVAQKAQIELSDTKLGGGGMRQKYLDAIRSIDFELSALDQVCMPCNSGPGIKVRAMGLQ